jgi:hypothetical protein
MLIGNLLGRSEVCDPFHPVPVFFLVFIDGLDANGTLVPTNGSLVTLSISGPGSIIVLQVKPARLRLLCPAQGLGTGENEVELRP